MSVAVDCRPVVSRRYRIGVGLLKAKVIRGASGWLDNDGRRRGVCDGGGARDDRCSGVANGRAIAHSLLQCLTVPSCFSRKDNAETRGR